MAELSTSIPLPVPETDDLGRYLEDTITIDWQTPSVADCARRLLVGLAEASVEARIERLFLYVRDEIAHSFDLGDGVEGEIPRGIACRASEVLALGHGLCFAKSHLLAALLRFAGHPTGFCYARLADDERPGRFTLHGFVACFEPTRAAWIPLDPRGNRGGAGPGRRDDTTASVSGALESVCRFDPPYSLAYVPDPARGESLLPFVYKRPAKRIVDFLERVPDAAAMRRNLPDSID